RSKIPEETSLKTSIAPSQPQTHDLRAKITQRSENPPEKALEVHDVPPELRKIIEAEKRRAANITANLRTCTIAINGVQMALSTAGVEGNSEFSQGLLIYLRAAIAQFMANGPARPLAPSVIRELICKHLECSLTDILLIRQTVTGFALTAKDKETRQLLLDKSSMISAQNAAIEPASDLVIYHIPNVPVAIQSPNNKVFVTKDMVEAEITRVTQASPT
ncbi:hypothetical protein EPUL_006281, partial [Erysiphe pulchra]